MDVNTVYKKALEVCKKEGWLNPPSRGDVMIVLQAIEELKKEKK